MGILKIKRIYDVPDANDGIRIFVDRLWARGITKERAQLNYWLKDIAPSPDLRKWFHHEPEKFNEFKKCYEEELHCKTELINEVLTLLKKNNVTLIYAAKSPTINHAIVLKDYIYTKKQK